ncbi:MAG: hypothetical protein RLY21_1312 [Planctomycetota bacterium]|jgi:hypothetical protein
MLGYTRTNRFALTSIACLGLGAMLLAEAAVASWVPRTRGAVLVARKTFAEAGSLTNNSVWEDHKIVAQVSPPQMCQTASSEAVTINHPWVPSGYSVATRAIQSDPVSDAAKAVLDVQCVSNWSAWGFAPSASFRSLSRCNFELVPNPPVPARRKTVWIWCLAVGSPSAAVGAQVAQGGPWGPAAFMAVNTDAGAAVVAPNPFAPSPRFTFWTQGPGEMGWTFRGASETVNRIVVFEAAPTGGFMRAEQAAGLSLVNPGPLANGLFVFGSYAWTIWDITPPSGGSPVVAAP